MTVVVVHVAVAGAEPTWSCPSVIWLTDPAAPLGQGIVRVVETETVVDGAAAGAAAVVAAGAGTAATGAEPAVVPAGLPAGAAVVGAVAELGDVCAGELLVDMGVGARVMVEGMLAITPGF